MNFSEFSNCIYKNLSALNNQGYFIGALFYASGSSFFELKPSYNTDGYQRKIFNGKRMLTQDMKASFSKPLDYERLKEFFVSRIGEKALIRIMDNFGVPKDSPDKDLLCQALCKQFDNIITEVGPEVENIVAKEYQKLRSQKGYQSLEPLYGGDDFVLQNQNTDTLYKTGFYQKFSHEWILKNSGTYTWKNRHITCINQSKIKIKTTTHKIDIPLLRPGEQVKIIAKFDSRGHEGEYQCIWEIRDEEGKPCFSQKKSLKLIVVVANKLNLLNGGNKNGKNV